MVIDSNILILYLNGDQEVIQILNSWKHVISTASILAMPLVTRDKQLKIVKEVSVKYV